MSNLHPSRQRNDNLYRRFDSRHWHTVWIAILATFFFVAVHAVSAQVREAGDQGGAVVSVGVMGSGSLVQYGDRKMIGTTGFVDAETHRRFGIEMEGRWLDWRQTTNVHLETYSVGGRYHLNFGRWEPYAKGLVGFGDFNFPYNLATGQYLVVTAGAGVDLRLNQHWYLRAADVEYQDWPQFTYGNMNTPTVSAGFKFRVF